jgi:hypothetical protein
VGEHGWSPASQSAPLEYAVIWPAAQLLRNRELFIVPALSLSREGWGMLVLCPFGLDNDVQPLLNAGFRLVGPRWTALREEDGQLSLLHLPGTVRQTCSNARRSLPTRIQSIGTKPQRIPLDDAGLTTTAIAQHQSFCDAVLIVEPTRRPVPQLRGVPAAHAPAALRRAWPMTELHPHRRQGRLPALLARHCQVFEAQLTPDPKHLLRFANAMRLGLAEGLAVKSRSAGNGATAHAPAAIVVTTTAVAGKRGAMMPSTISAQADWVPGASSMAERIAPHPAPIAGLYRNRLMGRIRPPKPAAAPDPNMANTPWSEAG